MSNTIKSNEFHVRFMLSKTKVFNISYYTLGDNSNPYFTTSCDVFNRPKSDYVRCGQCQKEVLKGYQTAKLFYQKWDNKHLKKLTSQEYEELINDMEQLFKMYPYLLEQKESNTLKNIGFFRIKEFSMTVYR